MRGAAVALVALGAFALWIWFTGPGTSLPLALGGGLVAVLAGRLAYGLLTPREPAPDTAPPPVPPPERPERGA
ncbi:hypothetical protein [Roseomonas sp. KE0001]|uniref:hypothetical protein n=1 Tax=unclassified Roseomonas TaxID=2617492 RepID=UPI0018DFE00A|nr:hypothetical protein [Roseomonas sp. KE0001]MBI0432394.1 hypothetical protein [Roseomonas sp. KE0001]